MADLTTFLRARLADREDQARADIDHFGHGPIAANVPPADAWIERTANEVLRDIEAQRRVIAELADLGHCPGCTGDPTLAGTAYECAVDGSRITLLRLLALPYADHDDYKEGWRP